MENRVEGAVAVNFSINHEGVVTDTKIISGIGHGCNEEAIRLVTLLRFDVPKTRGLRVLSHKTIHIHFHPPLPSAEQTIQYVYTTVPKKEEKPAVKPVSAGYNITVEIGGRE